VHLLLKVGTESISKTMRRIGVSFASYYHRKYRTSGHLFQGRFRSENVETHNYLLTVTRYIHQNPVKAGIARKADEWKWSSCAGYYGREYFPKALLDIDIIFQLCSDDKVIAKHMFIMFNELRNDD